MADLDRDLLALAGGDSSDEEDVKPTNTVEADSPPSSLDEPSTHVNGASNSKTDSAQRKSSKMKSGTKKTTKSNRVESEEEGEA